MRYFFFLLLSFMLGTELIAQDDVCPYLEVSAMRALPADPMQELGPRLEVEITIDTFISEWGIGGYVDLVLVDAAGDSLTRPTGPHHWLPGNPSDTSIIALPFQNGITALPDGFSGVLYTMHPVCAIEIAEVLSSDNQLSYELERVEIYPNPASARVTIAALYLQRIHLYSMTGQLLHSNQVDTESIELDLSQWRGHCFTVVLEDSNGRRSVRTILNQ